MTATEPYREASGLILVAFGLAVIAGPLMVLLPGPPVDPVLFGVACALNVLLIAAAAIPAVRRSGRPSSACRWPTSASSG